MEYSSWMEYLIKIACAIYSIDPTEIGWDISRGSGNSGSFEGSQAERLQHSKDKGLYPLLKFIQRKLNKYIVEQINPDFEFVFMGLNGMTISEELEMDIKKLNSFQTVNEIREKYELEPLEGGDMPENSTFVQAKNQAEQRAQQQMMNQQMMGGVDGEFNEEGYVAEADPFAAYEDEADEAEKAHYKESFIKAFDNFLKQEEEYGRI